MLSPIALNSDAAVAASKYTLLHHREARTRCWRVYYTKNVTPTIKYKNNILDFPKTGKKRMNVQRYYKHDIIAEYIEMRAQLRLYMCSIQKLSVLC